MLAIQRVLHAFSSYELYKIDRLLIRTYSQEITMTEVLATIMLTTAVKSWLTE